MKKILLLIICFFSIVSLVRAQITLEATYDTASIKLYMVNLELSGQKYIKVDRDSISGRRVRLYDLNHSLWKTIDLSFLPLFQLPASARHQYDFDVLYVSENLFNLDSNVELMVVINTGIQVNLSSQWFTGIYNENGVPLFTADSAGPFVRANTPQVFRPIYNTPLGTKMILSFTNGQAKVYSLGGILTTDNDLALNQDDGTSTLRVYPNPAASATTIEYKKKKKINITKERK